ncbi:rhodanese-like domain-containing protein [Jannaschia ovalis]|uniref:Rhodanese-like domain-containing protein n=1 Tax=Jannaschia ovalis TaxID=3038773 RepID=A0ABY8LCS1_9RHOB|nr:rhodanese-like domain-containing protein [Jannaschia sp. GRR-S6-38]WGH77983.1 rhodanese-like domain-containing protein [Jannaschia sp. GRR-S6-38]
MKSAKDYLEAANAVVTRIPSEDAVARHGGDALFVDVRDSSDIAKTGTIAGALRVPRGFMEFAADPESPYHNPALTKGAKLHLVCGAGGQAALAGKTLQDMGFADVTNIGGIGDWQKAGGPMEEA